MLSNESIGKLLIANLIPITVILIAEYYWAILPFGGICLILYILVIFLTTIWLAWVGLQTVIKQNKPFSYDYEKNIYLKYVLRAYSFIRYSTKAPKINEKSDTKNINQIDKLLKQQRSIDDRIADFTDDIEKYFIMKWYPKISEDGTFLNETKRLLDDVIRRFLQIVIQVDNKELVHGILMIFLRHTKEYRKTIKRQQSNPKSIEELYRYTHIASKNDKAFEHFMCQITTKIFRQFLSWELYNSVPCKCLISILAKKLITYMLVYISTPTVINYRIAQSCTSDENKTKMNFDKYDAINLTDINLILRMDKIDDTATLDKHTLGDDLTTDGHTPKVSPKKTDARNIEAKKEILDTKQEIEFKEVVEEKNLGKDEVDKDITEEIVETDLSHAISAPVKIYKSQSDKTWRNSSDLECISLGQDLLVLQEINDPDLQIQDLIDKKPWKDNLDSLEVDEKHHPMWNITENIEEVLESKEINIPSPNIPSFISNTIKPIGNVTASTLHNMKEFQQSTVNNVVKPVSQATHTAMHKIGDLQDEAAGVMEGIFDFGMAGIRKGLRLTGLQENVTDRTKIDFSKMTKPFEISPLQSSAVSKPQKINKLAKVPHVSSEDAKSTSQDESIWINPLIKDSPNFDGQILLEKSPIVPIVPTISMEDTTSPDPEYEDVTDLATTTAKLRSLLQQRTSESNVNTPAVSPMPFEEINKSFSSPLEYTGSSAEDVEVDGALPSLYKFCARTATGVFQNTLNTIKTALPGQEHNRGDDGLDRNCESENWMYVASDPGVEDFANHVEKLLYERRAFCTVDNAYEAVESLDVLDHLETGWNTPSTTYDDEVDDLEMHLPFTKTLTDIFCELVSESDTFLVQESVIKILLILFGELSEEYICNKSSKVTRSINGLIGNIPNEPKKDNLKLSINEFALLVLDIFPSYLKTIVGKDIILSAIKALLSSLQSQKINQDILLQIFELFASLLIDASNKMTPAYSA